MVLIDYSCLSQFCSVVGSAVDSGGIFPPTSLNTLPRCIAPQTQAYLSLKTPSKANRLDNVNMLQCFNCRLDITNVSNLRVLYLC